MTLTSVVPTVTAIATVGAGLTIAAIDLSRWRGAWLVPAAASLGFSLFTLVAVVAEGPLGFWPEHERNLWGTQIWIDLCLAVGVGFAALTPHARALRMRLVPWFVLIVCTGSIALLAMAARVLYLRDRAAGRRI